MVGAMAAALFGIGRTTGSGWAVVVLAGLVAVIVVGVVAPVALLRRLRVSVEAPRLAMAGRPVLLSLRVSPRRRVLLRTVDPVSEWFLAAGPAEGELAAVPQRRGTHSVLLVEACHGGLLGLLVLRRRLRVDLPVPLDVGPAPVPVALPAGLRSGAPAGEPRSAVRVGADIVRGVRDYQVGDAPRLVHWPASARRGELVVKELEEPERPRLAVVVDLRGPQLAAEEAAARAAGLAGAALRDGVRVTLLTAEAAGPVAGAVEGPAEIGHRLARAVAGEPASGPVPEGSVVVRIGTR